MLVSDWELMELGSSIITPFVAQTKQSDGQSRLSYGLSSHGYDIRLSPDDFRLFSPVFGSMEIDPKNFDSRSLVSSEIKHGDSGSYFVIPPFHYGLGITIERFKIPTNMMGICLGKSTYARIGLIVNTTPLEAGWKGRLVVELANTAPLPIRVYANEGIGQVCFFKSEKDCHTSYADRKGKYQNQNELVTAKV